MVMLFVYNLVYYLLGEFDALYLCVYVVLPSVIVAWFHFKFVYFARSFLSRRVGGCISFKRASQNLARPTIPFTLLMKHPQQDQWVNLEGEGW